jgi:hypothetical protein
MAKAGSLATYVRAKLTDMTVTQDSILAFVWQYAVMLEILIGGRFKCTPRAHQVSGSTMPMLCYAMCCVVYCQHVSSYCSSASPLERKHSCISRNQTLSLPTEGPRVGQISDRYRSCSWWQAESEQTLPTRSSCDESCASCLPPCRSLQSGIPLAVHMHRIPRGQTTNYV